MKILVVSRSVFSNNPQSIRFRSFMEIWKKNNAISLLTFQDNLPIIIPSLLKGIKISTTGKNRISRFITNSLILKKNKTEVRKKKNFIKTVASQIRIRKIFFPDVYIFTLKDLKKKLRLLVSSTNYDIIIISAFPFSFQILGFFLKKKVDINTILIYDTGDPFYGNSSKTTQGLLHKILSKYYEFFFLSYFDYIVVASQIMKSHYLNKLKISKDEKKIIVIPQGIHIREQQELIHNKKEIENEKISRLIYAGNFYKGLREPFEFYRACNLIENIKVDMYGKIPDYFKTNIESIKFPGVLDNIQIMQQYMLSNIVVLIDNNKGIQVPGKVYEILSLKKPVLFIYSNPESPSLKIVEDYDYVFLAKNETIAIKKKILDIINFNGCYNFNFQTDNYNWETLANEYLDSIK